MSKFSDLQSQHEKLIKAQASEEIEEQVQQYIEEVKSAGSQVASARERDQLRANLRYWASYIYEKTGKYPNVELAPSALPPESHRNLFISVGIIGAFLALIAIGYWGYLVPKQGARMSAQQTDQAALVLEATDRAALQTLNFILTSTASSSGIATQTPTVENTQVGAISIQITSVKDGDHVPAITQLSGNYSNLSAGYSIHAIIQPLSKGNTFFPMEHFASVSPASPTGNWSIEAVFGQGTELRKTEDYKILMVAAMNDDARKMLMEAVSSGFQRLPEGVIQFPQTVIVTRDAYVTAIDGIQVIYSSYLNVEGNWEIFSMNPDGTEKHRITYTSGKSERFPNLSPDGKQIVYVAHTLSSRDSIEIINSDNTANEVVIPPKGNLVYERPMWSSDGLYIAYAVGTPQGTISFWSIEIYDIRNKKSFPVAEDEMSNRYFSWIPQTHDLIFDARLRATATSGFVEINIMTPEEYSIYFDGKGEEIQPAVSPDGTHLAYMQVDSMQADNIVYNIYVLDKVTGKISQLTQGNLNRAPVWSLDGKRIYFESSQVFNANQDGHYCIWSINMDGTDPIPLTTEIARYPSVGYMKALVPGQP